MPELVTVDQAAESLSISRASIFRMLRAGELVRFKRRGSTVTYVDRRALARLLKPRPAK